MSTFLWTAGGVVVGFGILAIIAYAFDCVDRLKTLEGRSERQMERIRDLEQRKE
jgi:hypothetical protein